MNRKIKFAAILLAASTATAFAANSFKTWIGAEGNPQIETGLVPDKDVYGYWSWFIDNNVRYTNIDFMPALVTPEPTVHRLDQVIRYCGGVCGTAILDTAKNANYPASVGIAFSLAVKVKGLYGEVEKTYEPDASSWGGICVTYTSDKDLIVDLVNEQTKDFGNYVAPPQTNLPASETGNRAFLAWSDFKQPSSYKGNTIVSGEDIAKQLLAIRFFIKGEPGEYKFNFCAIGPKDGTCPETCEKSDRTENKNGRGTAVLHGTAAIKAILNGRALSITGVDAGTAEVMNSLGQVVAKGTIESATSTLNLAHLDDGIYLVRIVGKSTNFTSKIVLK